MYLNHDPESGMLMNLVKKYAIAALPQIAKKTNIDVNETMQDSQQNDHRRGPARMT